MGKVCRPKSGLAQYSRRLCPKPLQTLLVLQNSRRRRGGPEVSTKTVPAAFPAAIIDTGVDTGGAASPGFGEGINQRNH